MIGPAQYARYNPFRAPDWRYSRVLKIITRDTGPGRSSRFDDEHVRMLRSFVLRWRSGNEAMRDSLMSENISLAWAYQIFLERNEEYGHRRATLMECRLLARQTDEQICEAELGTYPDVSRLYELMFFNVRDRIDKHDWIVNDVLLPAFKRDIATLHTPTTTVGASTVPTFAKPFYDATLRFFAYFGGPLLLDFMLTGFRRDTVVRSREEVDSFLDTFFSNRLRSRSATASMSFDINRYNIMELFSVHSKLIEISKNANTDDKRDQGVKAIATALQSMTWATGRAGAARVSGTPVEALDKQAAEPRDAELLSLSLGQSVDSMADAPTQMPPPRIPTEPKEPK